MIDVANTKVGDKVHYLPEHYSDRECENGIVKEIPGHTCGFVKVVYNCAGNWSRYSKYTAAMTSTKDLYAGWRC